MVHAVQPDPARILTTPGLHEATARLLEPEVDPSVRSLAAGMLMAAYRADERHAPADPAALAQLCDAVAESTEVAIARNDSELAALAGQAAGARQWCSAVASIEPLLQGP